MASQERKGLVVVLAIVFFFEFISFRLWFFFLRGCVMTTPDADECAICLEQTVHRLYPCSHVVCDACQRQWRKRSNACPLCRGVVVHLDRGETSTPRLTKYANLIVNVDFPQNTHGGITLKNSAWFPKTVYVRRLETNDRCATCGLRRGDYILAINDVAVPSHEVGVRLIDHAAQTQQAMRVHVRRFRWQSPRGVTDV